MSNISHSDSLDQLASALAKAQAEIKGAEKTSTNPFFKSTYADLSSVWTACRAALTGNGLSVVQLPGFENGVATLTTILLHSSGQWIEGTAGAPIAKQDAQGVGGVITYLRRYALAAVAGVVQEDDDGESAVRHVRGKPAASSGAKDPTAPAVRQPLNEKPAALEVRWPGNGPNGGKLVKDLGTEELMVGLKWAKAKAHFDLVQAIEEELDDRGGEVRPAK